MILLWSPLDQSPTGAYWLGRDAGESGEPADNPFASGDDEDMTREWQEGFDDGRQVLET